VYLETKSVVVTSVMAGVYTGTVALSGVFLGSLVDRYKKKTAMLLSSLLSQQYQAEPQEAELLEASI
jgi:DHA3 family multidrug efflux protein-like MFS transporter